MKKNFRITSGFVIKTLLFMIIGVLSFLLGFSKSEHLSALSRYEICRNLLYVVFAFGVFSLIQIVVGLFWKPVRRWGWLSLGIGGYYALITAMMTIETRSPKTILYVSGATVVAALAEIGIGFLAKKYEWAMRIIGRIFLVLIVGSIGFSVGYWPDQNEGEVWRLSRMIVVSGTEALALGLIVLGLWRKSIRRWESLAFWAFLGIVAQMGSYVMHLGGRFNFMYFASIFLPMVFFGFLLLQVLVGLAWKPARNWRLLATSIGVLFVSVLALTCIDGRSFMPVVYMSWPTIVVVLCEMLISYLLNKYKQKIRLFKKIGLYLIVALLAFILGYGRESICGQRMLVTFQNARSVIFITLFALLSGSAALGIFRKSERKWGRLAMLVLLTCILAVSGQVADYVVRKNASPYTKNEDIGVAYKPIIYLYPKKETMVTVQLGKPENLTYTYPVYQDGWTVKAAPNGTLTDPQTKRTYYALYWEGKTKWEKQKFVEGFVVPEEETIPFLEEKLNMLGLTEREADEFIVYWLPKLGEYKYNFIRFQTRAEQDENMPLYVTPEPNTVIRVMMEYRGLNKPIYAVEQQLEEPPERRGFTLVEWGGTPI